MARVKTKSPVIEALQVCERIVIPPTETID